MSNVCYMAGFPRSGSTLLMNILKQNPKIHTTPTNGLIDMVVIMQKEWSKNSSFKSQNQNELVKNIENMLSSMITGFYKKEIEQGKICIDKSRGWVAYIDLLEKLFDKNV